jgi:hypothetical protein
MPYLTDDRKEFLANPRNKLSTAGDLTYCLTEETLRHIDTPVGAADGVKETADWSDNMLSIIGRYLRPAPRYADFALVLGCLDSTRRELLRRRHETTRSDVDVLLAAGLLEKLSRSYYANVIAPYEDTKIEQNGDVY